MSTVTAQTGSCIEAGGPRRRGPRVATPRTRPVLPILAAQGPTERESVTRAAGPECRAPLAGAPRAAFRTPHTPGRSTSRRSQEHLAPPLGALRASRRSTARRPQEHLAPPAGAPRATPRSASHRPQERLAPPSDHRAPLSGAPPRHFRAPPSTFSTTAPRLPPIFPLTLERRPRWHWTID